MIKVNRSRDEGPDGRSCIFESQEFAGAYLSGENNGTQFRLELQGAGGFYQQFQTHAIVFGDHCDAH